MTGRINLTPEAERQLNEIDDWIAENATAEIARRFVSAILEHIDGILVFPLSGRPRDDVRPGMRTTTYKKRTLVAYEVDESSGEIVVNVVGVFHGGQNWGAALSADDDSEEVTVAQLVELEGEAGFDAHRHHPDGAPPAVSYVLARRPG